jgi:hypothetical protein
VAKTHWGVLRFSESKDVLKNLGLSIDQKQYYNLMHRKQSYLLSPQEEALIVLHYLEAQDVYVVINKQYILDESGNKTAWEILCIV